MASKFKIDTEGSGIDYGLDDIQNKPKRITVDNKYFHNLQVKDIKSIMSEDCTLHIDSDTIPFRGAALQDKNSVEVSHPDWEEPKLFDTKTKFKGASTKTGVITNKSWLGAENIKREAGGLEPYNLDEFTITPKKVLKKEESLCIKNIESFIDDYINSIKFQFGCDNIVCHIGEGDNFRHEIKLPERYKSNRSGQARPLLLQYARDYLQKSYPTEVAEDREADDRVQQMGWEGYKTYLKTGKFDKVIILLDKDGYQAPCLLGNYNKSGPKWIHPNPVLIESPLKYVGAIEMVNGECKCTGLMQTAFQLICGDSSDHYHSYLKLPKEWHPDSPYSDASFYKDFVLLKTPKEVLDKLVEVFYIFFPEGLKYTAWDGTEMDIDTLSWLQMLFTCQYMLRSDDDTMTITKMMDYFKVDYSKLVDNNKPQPLKLADTDTIMSNLNDVNTLLDTVMSHLSNTKGNKPDLIKRLEDGCDELNKLKTLLRGCYE